jgi:hypothetical protein
MVIVEGADVVVVEIDYFLLLQRNEGKLVRSIEEIEVRVVV